MLELPDTHHREVQPTPADPDVELGGADVANEGLGAEPEEVSSHQISSPQSHPLLPTRRPSSLH
ncbi:unnamed protein product [Echinostoma caproni]|uniref:Uncharacterized protein n=1 Tax=Echinostoma caproni TaxID=27848 RepID=A0A183A4D5_9TREM|nr:unnamed protein product [Echinostoma caproni]